MSSPECALVFGHLLECRDCRDALSFVIQAGHALAYGAAHRDKVQTHHVAVQKGRRRASEVKSAISTGLAQFLARHRPGIMPVRLAPERADAIAAGLESGGGPLVFRGGQGRVGGTTWLAEVGIQPGDCAAEWLDVKVSCKVRGREVFDGEFRLCGATAQIKGGEGRLSREALARGLAEGGVSFAPSGGRAISGTPVFGELM